jgi:hypothetical protein
LSNEGSAHMNERILILILRITGGVSLLATIFVFVPYSWMNTIHQMLGMGELPSNPIVGYLARSTSALYVFLGGLLLVLAFDVRRYKIVLTYLGIAFSLFGLVLVFVDWIEGLPLFWKIWEGPFVFVLGIAIFYLNHRINTDAVG